VKNTIAGKAVKVEKVITGTYGRTIGKVYFNGSMINEVLVSEGLTRLYDRYCDKRICDQWQSLQAKKQADGIGL
jgi:endonuclease YncB( thermonuclease family)